jgi:predicted class III extradiol MEMO1 family dioxygenase
MVGSLSTDSEAKYGQILGPFLDDPANLFVISSDFCHWGRRFSYTFYDQAQARGSLRGQVVLRGQALSEGAITLLRGQSTNHLMRPAKQLRCCAAGPHLEEHPVAGRGGDAAD